jgi:hypothetical protein
MVSAIIDDAASIIEVRRAGWRDGGMEGWMEGWMVLEGFWIWMPQAENDTSGKQYFHVMTMIDDGGHLRKSVDLSYAVELMFSKVRPIIAQLN